MFKRGDRVVSLTTLADSEELYAKFGWLGTVVEKDTPYIVVSWGEGRGEYIMHPKEIRHLPPVESPDDFFWNSLWDTDETGNNWYQLTLYWDEDTGSDDFNLEVYQYVDGDSHFIEANSSGLSHTATQAEIEAYFARAWAHFWRGLGIVSDKSQQ
jgi:hypothetical protein